MHKKWIKQNNHAKLILFFNGWGMDSATINHLKTGDYDIVEFNDYKDLEIDIDVYKCYSEIYVVAWSLGVLAASLALANTTLSVKKSIAINGTLNPVDAKEGIHPSIFKGTYEGWNEKNRKRFLIRIIGEKKLFEIYRSNFGTRLIDNQKEELAKLYDYSLQDIANKFHFDVALIGKEDAIFPCKNQLNYWYNKSITKILDSPHYPFLLFTDWDRIITQ